MWYFFLTVFFTTSWLMTFKAFPYFKINTFRAVVLNYWVCVVTGLVLWDTDQVLQAWDWSAPWLPWSGGLALLFISNFYLTASSSQQVGAAVTVVANRVSMVLPVVFSLWLLPGVARDFHWINYIGILLALVAVVLASYPAEGVPLGKNYFYLPLIVFLLGGVTDTLLNYVNFAYLEEKQTLIFTWTTFLGAALLGSLRWFYLIFFQKSFSSLRDFWGGLALGVPNFLSLYFLLKTLRLWEHKGALVFPLFNVLVILLSTGLALLIYREKPSYLNLGGILLALLALLLITYS